MTRFGWLWEFTLSRNNHIVFNLQHADMHMINCTYGWWVLYILFSDSVGASNTKLKIKNLLPDVYTLWMTASTAKGEGPKSHKGKFPIKRKTFIYIQKYIYIKIDLFFTICDQIWKGLPCAWAFG